jgi:DNA invertase Pin-like site-specific DNA recombinase
MKILTERKRKSEPLTKEEHKALLKLIADYHTLIDAAYAIGIQRQTLERVKFTGSGSPETIEAIRAKLVTV